MWFYFVGFLLQNVVLVELYPSMVTTGSNTCYQAKKNLINDTIMRQVDAVINSLQLIYDEKVRRNHIYQILLWDHKVLQSETFSILNSSITHISEPF